MEDTKNRLREVYAKALKTSPEHIGDDGLIVSLNITSISALEVLIWVEDEFGITVEDQDLKPELVDSLDTLAEYIETRVNL